MFKVYYIVLDCTFHILAFHFPTVIDEGLVKTITQKWNQENFQH